MQPGNQICQDHPSRSILRSYDGERVRGKSYQPTCDLFAPKYTLPQWLVAVSHSSRTSFKLHARPSPGPPPHIPRPFSLPAPDLLPAGLTRAAAAGRAGRSCPSATRSRSSWRRCRWGGGRWPAWRPATVGRRPPRAPRPEPSAGSRGTPPHSEGGQTWHRWQGSTRGAALRKIHLSQLSASNNTLILKTWPSLASNNLILTRFKTPRSFLENLCTSSKKILFLTAVYQSRLPDTAYEVFSQMGLPLLTGLALHCSPGWYLGR